MLTNEIRQNGLGTSALLFTCLNSTALLGLRPNAPDRDRTCDLRFRNPTPKITKPAINQSETHDAENVLARRWALLAQNDSRLPDLIDGWAKLPDAMRDAVVHIVIAASKPLDSV